MLNDMHILDLLPAYALGILEEDEARQVADHLAQCTICRQELIAYQQVADQLGVAVPRVTPPVELKSRLVQRIHRLAEQRVAKPSGWTWPQRWVPAGALAGVLVILLLAISNLLLWQRLNNLEVLTGPLGMRAIALQNTSAALEASAFVVMGADGKNGVIVVDALPPLDESHEYQVWLLKDGHVTSAGTFGVDEYGYRGMRLTAPDSLLTYSGVAVTVEPAGGSTSPTGAQVLQGSLFNP